MTDDVKQLSEDDHSCVCTYLGFARDAAVRADWARRTGGYVDFSMRDLVTNLKVVADLLGLELVERHPQPITDRLLDQLSGETTAAELITDPPHPGVDVVASR